MRSMPSLLPVRAYIGLGANLGEPLAQLRAAVAGLAALPGSTLVAVSPLYRSAPLGPAGQPDYFNAVTSLDTCLTPHGLLAALQAIETANGRVRLERWGPRTLDLDLLLYGNDRIATPDLTVPHPELGQRCFVLVPLHDLAPELILPDGRVLAELAAQTDRTGLILHERHWSA